MYFAGKKQPLNIKHYTKIDKYIIAYKYTSF